MRMSEYRGERNPALQRKATGQARMRRKPRAAFRACSNNRKVDGSSLA